MKELESEDKKRYPDTIKYPDDRSDMIGYDRDYPSDKQPYWERYPGKERYF